MLQRENGKSPVPGVRGAALVGTVRRSTGSRLTLYLPSTLGIELCYPYTGHQIAYIFRLYCD